MVLADRASERLGRPNRALWPSRRYNPFGQQATATIGGTATSYLYDGTAWTSNVVQEQSAGTPTANLLTGAPGQVFQLTTPSGTNSSLLTGRLGGLEWLPLPGMADPSSRSPPTIWRDLPVSASRGRAAPTLVPVTRIEVHRGGAPPRLALIDLLGLIGLFEVLL